MTNQEKSKVIAEKLKIHWCKAGQAILGYDGMKNGMCYLCEKPLLEGRVPDNPDFFTPDGQVVLAKALLEIKLKKSGLLNEMHYMLLQFLNVNYPEHCTMTGWLTIIADTKLASLFYEFIESEGV